MSKITKFKTCKTCGLKKLLSEFYMSKGYNTNKKGEKTYYNHYGRCRSCDLTRLKKLNKMYPDKNKVNQLNDEVNWKAYLRNLRYRGKANIKFKEFKLWLDKQKNKCTYCDCSLEDSKKVLKKFMLENWSTKSNKFQIDRKNNEKGYTIDNICFACPICNFHKGDFFTFSEFKKIAKKYIKPKMETYLL